MNSDDGSEQNGQALDIALVGPCSSGKSTLKQILKARGFEVRAISQEHSYVPYMWQMHRPDVLIYLDLNLETLRARRKPNWSAALLDQQKSRLTHARQHADFYIATDNLTPEQVAGQLVEFLATFDPSGRPDLEQPELLRRVQAD